MESRVSSLLLLFLVAPAASAEPLNCSSNSSNSHLWRVNGSTPVYIYGTLHVPYPQLWDSIPHNVKVAFTGSTDFYLELDTSQSEVMQKVKQLRLLPEGQTLRGVISRELYNRVEGYIRRLQPLLRRWIQREAGLFAGFYVDQMVYSILGEWQRMRPVWLLNLLNSLTEQQVMAGGSRPLLDIFLRQAAEGMGKQVHALESVEDQMEPLSRLSLPEVEFAMGIQLTVLEKYVLAGKPLPQVGDVLTEYVCGNFSSMVESEDVLISSISKDNMTEEQLELAAVLQAHVMRLMRYQRNKKMALRIAQLALTGKGEAEKRVHFVAMGAGHLVGDRSVLEYLRSLGFDVEQVGYLEELEGPAVPDNFVAMGDPPPQIMDLTKLKDFFEDDDDDDTFTIDPSIFSTGSPTTWLHPTTQSIIQTTATHPRPTPEEPTDTTKAEEDHSPNIKVSVLAGTTSRSDSTTLQGASSSAAMATYHSGVCVMLCVLAFHTLTNLL